jgi:hypothetical protein
LRTLKKLEEQIAEETAVCHIQVFMLDGVGIDPVEEMAMTLQGYCGQCRLDLMPCEKIEGE